MTVTQSVFINPFGDPNDDHDTPDPLCMARINFAQPMASTIEEFYEAAVHAIANNNGQAAFYNIRQLAELVLKGLQGPNHAHGHNLDKLLKVLEDNGDDLFTGTGEDQHVIVAFIRKLAEIDPKGDEGRYPLIAGVPALSKVCHAEKDLLQIYVGNLYLYATKRVTW